MAQRIPLNALRMRGQYIANAGAIHNSHHTKYSAMPSTLNVSLQCGMHLYMQYTMLLCPLKQQYTL